GREHLPVAGDSAVLVCNHASYLDVGFIILALPSPVGFVAKAELSRNPLVRIFLKRLGVEFVERFNAKRGAADARALSQRLRAGKPLLYFPEGTFTATPGLRTFHMGAFMAAASTGMPLVPMALRGSREQMRPGNWYPHPGMTTLTITPAILPATNDSSSTWDEAIMLRDRARVAVLAHCGEADLG
ncbi:MAG: 1-acyl-sn-glycerol-3-phosphate acyltransferase, partial [Chromatiales bacterium]|nr:1-acyl-sn-glycerol-3-phosphate acyltransferase [Chromatiales bacterium]